MNIDLKELAKVPYLRVDAVGDRRIKLASFWDGVEWHTWIPGNNGKLFHVTGRLGEGSYVAKTAAVPTDIYFPFVDFVWKRAGWPDVDHWVAALIEDMHQLAASIGKIDFFWTTRDQIAGGSLGVRRFVSSELEYLLTVCRSMFDILQEIIRAIWKRVRLLDEEQQRHKGELGTEWVGSCDGLHRSTYTARHSPLLS